MPVPDHEFDDDLEIDYTEIEDQYKPQLDEGFEHVLVVDNVPIVDESKKGKLLERLCALFNKQNVNVTEDQIIFPWDDEAGSSKGFLFLTMPSAQEADYAARVLDQCKFGKSTLLFNKFSDVERYANVDPQWVEPEEKAFVPKAHLKKWLADPAGRDQYVTLRGQSAAVFWNGRGAQAEEIPYKDAHWGDYFLSWSPLGTFLASTHGPGVALWGGEKFQNLNRYSHPHVALIDFSPCENYLITCSTADYPITVPEGAPTGPDKFSRDEDEGNHIAVWEIKTGRLVRTFPGEFAPSSTGQVKAPRWPALKWSPDDAYVARLTTGTQISIYAAPLMELVDKKSIKIEGVADFAWCPNGEKDKETAGAKAAKGKKENVLAYWTPEVGNQPARVSLIGFPSRTLLRTKNLFNVSDCKLHWQDQGDFLCVKVDRHTKSGKSTFCNLEIFRMREKNYPVEVLELKDPVTAFAWEPKSERFGIVTCNDPNLANPGPGITIKYNVSFYQIDPKKGDFRLFKTLEGKTSNRIFWSPRGRQVVLATFESSQKCDIEFWDLDFTTDELAGKKAEGEWGANVQLLSQTEHYGMTDIAWDPSGRYLTSHATSWRPGTDSGYAIWDFKGQELKRDNVDHFKQFLWRPRPPTLLPKDQQKQVRKSLKEYSRTFDEEDAAADTQGSAEVLQYRRRLIDEWNTWLTAARKALGDQRERLGVYPTGKGSAGETKKEEQDEVVEEWIEEVIEEKEEIVA
ncbi:translation initiation factor eif-3b [Phaffia rhodozyma]|uniref:Eukaryotic translation initiation factor 3 subunit B n=1 Tax=Phaffia rhodozyma TaxID=264483 RepID=A0A0F7SQ31_PHARH|nr:translation initiation factor eif-3b [Phaffia rhodozyma]